MATGFPTMSLLPITTARAPFISMPLRRRISIIPAGVQGTKPGRPWTRLPTLTGWNPSTSLRGSMASSTALESTCGGSGSWTRMPSISSRALSSCTSSSRRSVVVSAGHSIFSLEAERLAGLDFIADVDLGGRVLTDEDRCQPGCNARSLQLVDLAPEFVHDFITDFVAVKDARGQWVAFRFGLTSEFTTTGRKAPDQRCSQLRATVRTKTRAANLERLTLSTIMLLRHSPFPACAPREGWNSGVQN